MRRAGQDWVSPLNSGVQIEFFVSRLVACAMEMEITLRALHAEEDCPVGIEYDYYREGGACRITCLRTNTPTVSALLRAAIGNTRNEVVSEAATNALKELAKAI